MADKDNIATSKVPQPWQPRFGLGGMMMVMLVLAVVAAGASYMVRAQSEGQSLQLAFILFTLAAPVLLVVAVSLLRQVMVWLNRRGRH
jgi:hypothetical protein